MSLSPGLAFRGQKARKPGSLKSFSCFVRSELGSSLLLCAKDLKNNLSPNKSSRKWHFRELRISPRRVNQTLTVRNLRRDRWAVVAVVFVVVAATIVVDAVVVVSTITRATFKGQKQSTIIGKIH